MSREERLIEAEEISKGRVCLFATPPASHDASDADKDPATTTIMLAQFHLTRREPPDATGALSSLCCGFAKLVWPSWHYFLLLLYRSSELATGAL